MVLNDKNIKVSEKLVEVIRFLDLEKTNVNCKRVDGITPLHVICCMGMHRLLMRSLRGGTNYIAGIWVILHQFMYIWEAAKTLACS